MSAYQLHLLQPQEISEDERQRLKKQLSDEISACIEIQKAHRNKAEQFMGENNIWSLTDITYETRCSYEKYLRMQMSVNSVKLYLAGFDRLKIHSLEQQAQTLSGRQEMYRYQNQQLFLLYHPNPELAKGFKKTPDKESLVWDFERRVPEILKRQIFKILHREMEQNQHKEGRRARLEALKKFYDYCVDAEVSDIEYLETEQIKEFYERLKPAGKAALRRGREIVETSRKFLFMEAGEINWRANVWYLERFHFESTRVNPSNPVISLSFIEIQQKKNRQLMQEYMKYCLGTTNLSISVIRAEASILRRFLVKMQEYTKEDICSVTTAELENYFSYLEQQKIQPETYNKAIKSILHFFDYLKVRGFIERVPFQEQYYLKKTVVKHHDRSVTHQVYVEIMQKLGGFPEDLRLMFLHQWAIGLRASEVCTLKGNAYYTQGGDTWLQVYQIKMKNYKRIPIPIVLYRLMKIYIDRYQIDPEDYIFKNRAGGAYCYCTYKNRMHKYCKENAIDNGGYLFQSHDYRHTLATFFYNQGVSIQGVRDYLGHTYEEMTQQYIDFMPRKIRKANEEYFRDDRNSLAGGIKKRSRHGK